MSDFHFGYDNDLWVYPPLDDDYEMAEWLEAVEIDGQLFVDADDAITQVRALQAENDKLRELVETMRVDMCEMLDIIFNGSDTRGYCRYYRERLDAAEGIMRELGI